ncbi:hypothetical protein CMI37_11080 [Candidatus Pacearchaeota archaeon]|nr:hypothetical protein [Candidatus Pacearchaeota archaeon]|tara:strand:+ start:3787 stop:4050 length:264 start_codon:yes stop_codon:yes gene_type:complete
MEIKVKVKSIVLGASALTLFGLRFVPIYKLELGFLGSKWLSLSQLATACANPLLGLAEGCSTIGFLNPLVWVGIVGLGVWTAISLRG